MKPSPILAQPIDVRLPAAEWFIVVGWLATIPEGIALDTASAIDKQITAKLKPYAAPWAETDDTGHRELKDHAGIVCYDCWRQLPAWLRDTAELIEPSIARLYACTGCGAATS